MLLALLGCSHGSSTAPAPTDASTAPAPTTTPPSTPAPTSRPAPTVTSAPPDAPGPCGFGPSDWCPAPAGDPCGEHRDTASCKADARCKGMRYRGESVVACKYDERGFATNCPTVGCTSR